MIVQHNMTAINTYRKLSQANASQGKSMEKLSSGLRINRAGDDAAGLAISEKMRGQVRGLDQAARNSQDGISLIQTAEGALNETHSILQRMRELANQAANDTNTEEDRKEIQKEINQLTSEVNRIGNTTEFNTKKLLNAGSVDKNTFDNIIDGIENKGWLALAEQRIFDHYGLQGNGENLKVIIQSESPGGTMAYVTGSTGTTDQTLTIDADDFTPSSGDSGDNGSGGANYSDRVLAHEMVHAVMNSAFGVSKTIDMQKWFKEGSSEFIHGGDERLEYYISDGTGGIDSAKLNDMMTRATALLNGDAWNGDSKDYAAGYFIVKYMDKKATDAGSSTKNIMLAIQGSSAAGNTAVEDAIASQTGLADFDAFVTDFSANADDYIIALNPFTNGAEADTGSIAGSDHGGSALNAEGVFDNSTATAGQVSLNFNVELPDISDLSTGVALQVGANNGQSMTIELKDMRAAVLKIAGAAGQEVTAENGNTGAFYTAIDLSDSSAGVSNGTSSQVVEYALDVSTHSRATAAVRIFDDAIERVSSFRSELGSFQNRLEHTITNLTVASENLVSAESRIRDTDMAKEMMSQTKNSILSQAAQAMLAQANTQPQGVLQLLG